MSALYVRMIFGGKRVHLVRHAGTGAMTLCGRRPLILGFHVLPSPPDPEAVCRTCVRAHRRIYGSDLPAVGDAS